MITPGIDEIMRIIREFVDERDWNRFHRPAALAMSVAIEAGELLELFQWKSDAEAELRIRSDPAFRESLSDEIADVMIYLLRLCDSAGVNPANAILEKMEKNRRKYPVDGWQGRAPDHDDL